MKHGQLVAVSAIAVLVATTSSACGVGVAGALRPADPKASTALGATACGVAGAEASPLIVDWSPEERADLELAMKDNVAVVAYTCDTFRVLRDCHVEGQYAFIAVTPATRELHLDDEDELRANLPKAAALLGGTGGGGFDRGASLDIAYFLFGRKRTTRQQATSAELAGDCTGATHFVRGASVGAFALDTGTKANLRTAAEIFGGGASGLSLSRRLQRTTDGDLGACKADSDGHDNAPPARCAALIRLELTPIASDAAVKRTAATDADDLPSCPAGLVFADGKCTSVHAARPSVQAGRLRGLCGPVLTQQRSKLLPARGHLPTGARCRGRHSSRCESL